MLRDMTEWQLTEHALKHHIGRVPVQAQVWGQTSIELQVLLIPLQNATTRMIKSNTTEVLPALKAIIEMVKCHCKEAVHKDVPVGQETYNAVGQETFVFAVHNGRMTRTWDLKAGIQMTVMMMMMNEITSLQTITKKVKVINRMFEFQDDLT